MSQWIKIYLTSLFVFTFLITLSANGEARSGCCSWHDGVCGCRCCDGTSLSAKCAPYYPSCSKTKASINSYASQAKEKKWYQNGWVYVVGAIGLWIGGGWAIETINERREKKKEKNNQKKN